MKRSTLKSIAKSYLKASNAVSMIEEVQGEVQELWVNSSPEYGDDTQIEELQDQLDEAYSQACALEESLDQAGRDAWELVRGGIRMSWEKIKDGTA